MNNANIDPNREPHDRGCPKAEGWKQWLNAPGDSPLESDHLAGHLNNCEACRSEVARVSQSDTFFDLSRHALRSSGLSSDDWQHLGNSASEAMSPTDTDSPLVSIVQSLLGASDDDLSLGRVGRFEVLGIVGAGGMGIVLKARSIDMDRIVAIKIPQPQYWRSTDLLSTLEREARSASSVVHPNVISIYHVDRYRDVPYLVMPWLPGQSLQQRLHSVGPLPIEEVVTIARQVASALTAAHACGVVHRDVKPANILLGTGTDRVVLSDFGLAKVGADATRTATGMFAGTPLYLSPEQASGQRVGPPSDLYSLGTVIWTLLCGAPPMAGMHAHAIVRRIADANFPQLKDHQCDCPGWMERLVDRLHSETPEDRPTASELTGWLESCQQHLTDPESCDLPDVLTQQAPSRTPQKNLLIGATVMASVLGLVAAISFGPSLFNDSKKPPRAELTAPTTRPQARSSADVVSKDQDQPSLPTHPAGQRYNPSPEILDQTPQPADHPHPRSPLESLGETSGPGPNKTLSATPDLDRYLQSVRDELDQTLRQTLPHLDEEIKRLETSL